MQRPEAMGRGRGRLLRPFLCLLFLATAAPARQAASQYDPSPEPPSQAAHQRSRYAYEDPSVFLKPGTQSYISPGELAIVMNEAGIHKDELGGMAMIGKIYAWLGTFQNSPDGGASIGRNTASGLLGGRTLYGCTDWALLASSILRAAGMPALMADTVGLDWMRDFRSGRRGIGHQGHAFVEAYVEGRWILIEHNSRTYYSDYNPSNPVIPMPVGPEKTGFYVMRKGVDPAAYGIRDAFQLNALMEDFAMRDLGDMRPQRYEREPLPAPSR